MGTHKNLLNQTWIFITVYCLRMFNFFQEKINQTRTSFKNDIILFNEATLMLLKSNLKKMVTELLGYFLISINLNINNIVHIIISFKKKYFLFGHYLI